MTAETIVGIPRDDPLLTLDDAGLARRDAAIEETRRLRSEALGALGQPRTTDWATIAQSTSPQVGDLVLEQTRASWSKNQRMRMIGFGYLVARRGETWYVQYGPGPDDICDWENASFIVVPEAAQAVGRDA